MSDTAAAPFREGAPHPKARDDRRVATTGPVLPVARRDLRVRQRELVRASLIARPPTARKG